MSGHGTVTVALSRLRTGDADARRHLFSLVYEELRGLAHRQLGRFRPDQTLNTTALVHELFLKLSDRQRLDLTDRRHLFAVAATAMRQILVDYARSRRRAKRGGDAVPLPLERLDDAVHVEAQAESILALHQALGRLAAVDARLVQVVELRFFGGLSVVETAELLSVSAPTIKRDTRVARAFLQQQLEPGAPPQDGGGGSPGAAR